MDNHNLPEEIPNEIAETAKKAVRKRNRPDLANFGQENVKPGDNARYLTYKLDMLKLPTIDTSDEKQVADRIFWYFEFCQETDMKPSVSGLSLALGITRSTLHRWFKGEVSKHNQAVTEKAYSLLESLWEDYMQNGKVNPVSGIFLGKNHFGYQDKQEMVITPNNKLGEQEDPDAVRQRYLMESDT